MASSWLAGLGGAAGGLEQVLARHREDEMLEKRRLFQERQQTETERGNLADEKYRERALTDSAENRRLAREQATTAANRVQARADVDDDRAAWSRVPGGSIVAPADRNRSVGMGSMAASAFDDDATVPGRLAMRMGAPEALAENESVIKLRDNPTETAAKESRAATAENRRVVDEDRDSTRRNTQAYQSEMLRLARQREGRINEWGPPTITIANPDNPGQTSVIRRNDLPEGGARGPEGAASREKINAYTTTLKMIDDLKEFTDEEWASAIGPLDSTVGALAGSYGIEALGGGGARGELLRNRLSRLQAQASFAEGGKQFTGTEKDLLEAFLASAKQQPRMARGRALEFERVARGTLATMGAGGQANSTGGMGTSVGGSGAGGTTPAADPYEEYLRRRGAPPR
jgi:hypothetical protein